MVRIEPIDDEGVDYGPDEYDPLPAGWYAMQIIDTDVKEAQSGDGQYLKLTLQPLENVHPEIASRMVWDQLNIWHKKEKTQNIGRRNYQALRHAIGVTVVDETSDLHFKPVAVKLQVKPETPQYPAGNKVTKYEPIAKRFPQFASQKPSAQQQQSIPVSGQAPRSTGQEPPWKRK